MDFHCPRCGDIECDQVVYNRKVFYTELYTVSSVEPTGQLNVDFQDTIVDGVVDEYFECLTCGNRVDSFFDWEISTS